MEFSLAILLISALTTNGLLALWAATSPRHWFLRTAIYLASLLPLLAIPASDIFITLVFQAAVIASAVALYRWREGRLLGMTAANASSRAWRFSLSSLLQSMALLGLASAVAAGATEFNRFAWQSIVAIGVGGGLSAAIAAWASMLRGWKLGAGCLLALAASMLLGAVMGGVDWFVLSATNGAWVEDFPGFGISLSMAYRDATSYIGEWLVILPVGAVATLVVVWLWQLLGSTNHSRTRSRGRVALVRACLALTCVVLAAPAVQMLIILLNPEPIPVVLLPSPNGHDDLVAARKMLNDNLIVSSGNFNRDVATKAELVKAVAEVRDAIERVERALSLETKRPLDYSPNKELSFPEIQPTRDLSRALDAAGRLAEVEGDYGDSLRWHLIGVKHGFASRQGGLIVDDLVGVACTNVGLAGVFEIRQHLDRRQCTETMAVINDLIANVEPFADVSYRDRVWTQRVMGWMAHLSQRLDPESESESENGGSYAWVRRLELAKCRLLLLELAIVMFEEKHGRLPNSADELLSATLPAMPIDPLSTTEAPLQFKRTENGYLLYSVGRDGIDNNGKPPADGMSAGWGEPGDLRLDAEFTPQTVTEITTIDPAADALDE